MRVAIYLRVSTLAQKLKGRLQRQLDELREYCQAKGWQVVAVFNEGVCKKGVKVKEKLEEALSRANEFDRLVAVSLDRFGDNGVAYSYHIKFRNKGVGLVAVEEDVDSMADCDGFIDELYNGVDFKERDAKRTQLTTKGREKKIAQRIKEGKNPSLKPSYGLKDDFDICIVDVPRIFTQYLYEHSNTREIAKMMADITDKKGWNAQTVHNVLRNRAYTEVSTVLGYAPVSQYEFDRVQKRLQMTKGGYGKDLLSRVVWCRDCNEPMYLKRGKYECRECVVKIDKNELEEMVKMKVKAQFDEVLKEVLSSYGYRVYGEYEDRIRHRLGSKGNMRKLVCNWLPVEMKKKVLVSNDGGVEVLGLCKKEAYEVLEMDI